MTTGAPLQTDLVAILKGCAKKKDIREGIRIHYDIVRKSLLEKEPNIASTLISMYAKCGACARAQLLLDDLSIRDVVCWSAAIAGYAQQGKGREALACHQLMLHEGLSPNAVTFASILKACGSITALDKGKQIHDEVFSQGFVGRNVVIGSALVDMYVKCGSLGVAWQVLEELPARNAVCWSVLIAGYSQHGHGMEALECFEQMQHEGLSPDAVAFGCILKACGCIRDGNRGQKIHEEIIRQGLLRNNTILGVCLVDMYVKCGVLAKAQIVFDELPVRSVALWSSLIAGYAQQELSQEALNCFDRMQGDGFSPNIVTFICVLKACGSIGAAEKGKQIHDDIVNCGLLGKCVMLDTAIVDMYAKCGELASAQALIDELPVRDVVCWSALIAGCGPHGESKKALSCFEQMQCEGLSPDTITFICVLNACSHIGLVNEGEVYLTSMYELYCVTPRIEHLGCIVDLYGRIGHLDDAITVMKKIPSFDNPAAWSALLDACQECGNIKLARWAFERAVDADISNADAYICMANILAATGMHER